MPDPSAEDELTKLQQRMAELKRETQRIDIELQALQAEGEARMAEREDSSRKDGRLLDSKNPDSASGT